jgi:hypothetical protein
MPNPRKVKKFLRILAGYGGEPEKRALEEFVAERKLQRLDDDRPTGEVAGQTAPE